MGRCSQKWNFGALADLITSTAAMAVQSIKVELDTFELALIWRIVTIKPQPPTYLSWHTVIGIPLKSTMIYRLVPEFHSLLQ